MPIVRVPYGNALPTEQADYTKQNNLLVAGFMNVNKPVWEDAANNIVQGAIFQVGGTIYHCTAATAIGGVASDYIKLTPSGDGSTLTPTYVASLAGVTWNSAYNGYYDVGGNAYVFDEFAALIAGQIAACNTKIWQAFVMFLTQNMTFSGDPTLSGNPTLSGVATFDNGIIANGGIRTDGVNTLKIKTINIGDWNMDATANIAVAHGLTFASIRSVTVIIRNDVNSQYMPLGINEGDDYGFDNALGGVDATNVKLRRKAGGSFDSVSYDSTSYNRGWITIIYEV